jgi:uncharacterized membrane protein
MSPISQTALLILTALSIPFLVKKTRAFNFLGPVVSGYSFGILFAIFWGSHLNADISMLIAQVSIALSIGLLLLPSVGMMKFVRPMLVAFGLMTFSVIVSIIIGAIIFSEKLPQIDLISAMATGLFTGSAATMNGIGIALGSSPELLIKMNTIDLITGAVFFFALLTVAKPLVSKFLPTTNELQIEAVETDSNFSWQYGLLFLCMAIFLLVAGLGINFITFGQMGGVLVLCVISLGALAFSKLEVCQQRNEHEEIGMNFLTVFCVAVGSMFDLNGLNSSLSVLCLYFVLVLGLISLIHLALSKLFKIDCDTYLITLTAGLYGPPMISPVANAIKKPNLTAPGIACAMLGLIIGNYLGPIMQVLLTMLGI